MSNGQDAIGNRLPFRKVIDATPRILALRGPRYSAVFINEGPNAVYVGETGTPLNQWMYLPVDQGFYDTESEDDYWAYAPTGSGTVSGFVISA